MSEQNATTLADDKQKSPEPTPQSDKSANTLASKQEEGDVITLSKKEWERMTARQSSLDKKEQELLKKEKELAKKERKLKKATLKKEKVFSFEEPEPEEENEPTPEELALEQERELYRLERGVFQLLKTGKYNKLLEKDQTLAELLEKNPLGLPVFDTSPANAEEALDRIEDYLSSKLENISNETEETTPETPPVPEAGPTNPPESNPQPEKEEEKPKEPKLKSVHEVENDLKQIFLGG